MKSRFSPVVAGEYFNHFEFVGGSSGPEFVPGGENEGTVICEGG